VLEFIRQLSQRKAGTVSGFTSPAPALYGRARRLFGSWSKAVRGAGIDYQVLQEWREPARSDPGRNRAARSSPARGRERRRRE